MAMSDYLQDALRTHLFRSGTFTKPTELHVALHTADPLDDASGAEVTGGSYARVQQDPDDANWSAGTSTDGITVNLNPLTFPSPTADWGLVTHAAVWDAPTGGNLIGYGPLATPRSVLNGDGPPVFSPADVVITFV
jgi:hypothetical protein